MTKQSHHVVARQHINDFTYPNLNQLKLIFWPFWGHFGYFSYLFWICLEDGQINRSGLTIDRRVAPILTLFGFTGLLAMTGGRLQFGFVGAFGQTPKEGRSRATPTTEISPPPVMACNCGRRVGRNPRGFDIILPATVCNCGRGRSLRDRRHTGGKT
jgi:hypothetical protein